MWKLFYLNYFKQFILAQVYSLDVKHFYLIQR